MSWRFLRQRFSGHGYRSSSCSRPNAPAIPAPWHVGARLQQVRGKAVTHGGAQAIVFVTKSLTDLIQQSYGMQHRRGGGFHG